MFLKIYFFLLFFSVKNTLLISYINKYLILDLKVIKQDIRSFVFYLRTFLFIVIIFHMKCVKFTNTAFFVGKYSTCVRR